MSYVIYDICHICHAGCFYLIKSSFVYHRSSVPGLTLLSENQRYSDTMSVFRSRTWVRQLLVGYQDVTLQPFRAISIPHLIKTAVEVKAVELPHVVYMWLRLSKLVRPLKYLSSSKASFCIS